VKYSITIASIGMVLVGAVQANEPVWDANKVVLESIQLSDGVFAVIPENAKLMAAAGLPIATTSGFVIGTDGVLVIDSMLNERLSKQLFGLITSETNVPVKYMVNTSAHGDHSYGNHYLPEEITIIQHTNAQRYIQGYFAEDVTFMLQNFGEGRGIEAIKPTKAHLLIAEGGGLSVDLGGVSVDMKDFGFAQTGGDLFVSVPEANVLWAGNAVISTAPAVPWLLDGHLIETKNTLQAVHDAFNSETIVVPGHGPVTNLNSIQWNIDYLNAVETQVGESIGDGLSLEETVAKVQLPEFQGYLLFNWVHPGLNVPAAYNDLKQ
jgi:cyclase